MREHLGVRTHRGAPTGDPCEIRHVWYSPPNSTREDLEAWLNRMPGRLFLFMPYPNNAMVWMAVTVEEVDQ